MPTEQLKVFQMWLNEILDTGELHNKVTEQKTTVKLAQLHKEGPLANLTSHWRPVVLLNIVNQLITYVAPFLSQLPLFSSATLSMRGSQRWLNTLSFWHTPKAASARTNRHQHMQTILNHQRGPTSQDNTPTGRHRLQNRLQFNG